MLTPKQKAFADYYIECGGGGEVSGGDIGADERMEDINGKMGNRNTPTEAGKVSGDISSRYVRTAS